MSLRGKRILIAKPGLDGHDVGAKIITLALRDAGAEVIYTGLRKSPDYIARVAVQEDVDAVGLSILSGSHRELLGDTLRELTRMDAADIKVFVGGSIPPQDRDALLEAGAAAVFTSEMKLEATLAALDEVLSMTTPTERVDTAVQAGAPNRGPLAGIRIIEVGHMLAGPYAAMLLADLGAEVIKVESASGDLGRNMGPDRVGRHNVYFASLNRNKKSICLDLASADGQATLHGLVANAHGLLANLRPSAIAKLGLTYDALREHNPRLACVALTGYGMTGPFADRPAYDYVIQALTGVMYLTGDPGASPTKPGYSAVDNSSGIMAAFAMVAKILEGTGGQVDVALYDTMLSQLNYLAAAGLNGGTVPDRRADGAHPYLVPAQTFATADGYMVLFISHDKFWRLFAEEVGQPEWCTDTRFADMAARSAHRELVVEEVQAVLRHDTTANWVERLAPRGIVASAVSTLDDALQSELTRTRDMVVSLPSEDGPIRVLGCPIKLEGYTPPTGPPPLLGESGHG